MASIQLSARCRRFRYLILLVFIILSILLSTSVFFTFKSVYTSRNQASHAGGSIAPIRIPEPALVRITEQPQAKPGSSQTQGPAEPPAPHHETPGATTATAGPTIPVIRQTPLGLIETIGMPATNSMAVPSAAIGSACGPQDVPHMLCAWVCAISTLSSMPCSPVPTSAYAHGLPPPYLRCRVLQPSPLMPASAAAHSQLEMLTTCELSV